MSEASVRVVSFVLSATDLRGGYRYPRASQVAYPYREGYVTQLYKQNVSREILCISFNINQLDLRIFDKKHYIHSLMIDIINIFSSIYNVTSVTL